MQGMPVRGIVPCFLVLFSLNCSAQLMKDIARPATLPANAPKYSDVVMRSLAFRDTSFEHGSTMQNVLDFHVTRLDWVYLREGDEGYMKAFNAKGIKVGGTINSVPADSLVSIIDSTGKTVEVPWLPGCYFSCVNNPGELKMNLDHIKLCVDLGCVAIQRDGPGFGNVEYTHSCCFCSLATQTGWIEQCAHSSDCFGLWNKKPCWPHSLLCRSHQRPVLRSCFF